MKGAHLKLPTKNTRYSNEPNPTLRRPPRGRGRSPRKEASSSLFGSLLNFGFLTRLGAGDSGSGARRRKGGTKWDRFLPPIRSEINLSRHFRSSILPSSIDGSHYELTPCLSSFVPPTTQPTIV